MKQRLLKRLSNGPSRLRSDDQPHSARGGNAGSIRFSSTTEISPSEIPAKAKVRSGAAPPALAGLAVRAPVYRMR
jgi:hypothetical protein